MQAATSFYSSLAIFVLLLHALFILWVVFGAFLTRWRPVLRWLHIASLVWGILTELLPWPCPLTLLENCLEGKAGVEPYPGEFLLHYMDKLVYPSRVENRRRDFSLPVATDDAFASSPQSGLAWLCFLFPLVEPDRQVSRIRLSEKTH